MSVIQTWFGQDLQKAVKVNHIDGNLFSHNGNGNSIGVRVYNDGEPVTLTGTVSGYVITSDGSTVPCVGARSGNEATITIPPAAYQPGNAFITIFLTDGSTVTTLCAVQTTVLQARTGSQVSPGSVVTDWTQTINAAMQSVEDAAENLGGIIATPYASLTYPVPLGKYTYYNSNLYRCISPIETSEEFTAAHWIQVKLGDDVSALKSAIGEIVDTEIVSLQTKTMTGTEAAQWLANAPIIITGDEYICLYSTKNVTTQNKKMWFRVNYTDQTISDTIIINVGEWYKINFDSTKEFQQVNIQFIRSDSALGSDTESEWKYVVIKGEPLDVYKDELSLSHDFATGHIVGEININTDVGSISVPGGTFYINGESGFVNIPARELQYDSGVVYQVIVVNYETTTYELVSYADYRNIRNTVARAVMFFRKSPFTYTTPYQVVVNGVSLISLENDITALDDSINDIETVTGTVYTKTFASSGSHSSLQDTISCNVLAGETILLSLSFANNAILPCVWRLTNDDNSEINLRGSSGSRIDYTSGTHIVKIGVYYEGLTESTTANVYVRKWGEFDELRNRVTPSIGNVYSTNADGITKTALEQLSSKKLYIPNGTDGGPSVNQQGAAYEDGKIIIATHQLGTAGTNSTLDVWDYETATRLYSFPIANDEIGHGNNIIATGTKIDANDVCSLLLISDSESKGNLYVVRVTASGCSVLHKIEFNVSDVGYFANYLLNDKNGTIVSVGYAIESVTNPNGNSMIIAVWDVTGWDEENTVPTAQMRYKYTLPYLDIFNGGVIRNGIMYIMCTPFQFEDYTYVAVSPIEIKAITNRWSVFGKSEYENINFVDDQTIIYGAYWFYKSKLKFIV